MNSATSQLADQLVREASIYTLDRLNKSGPPPPAHPGVYGWWFLEGALPMVPTMRCLKREDRSLLYAGIARKHLRQKTPTTLHDRIVDCHIYGKATNSTLRASLRLLLEKQLGTIPAPISPKNWGFSPAAESEPQQVDVAECGGELDRGRRSSRPPRPGRLFDPNLRPPVEFGW